MRAVVGAMLACLFLVMAVTDRFVCADGCADEAPVRAATPHASAPCAFCQGWSQTPLAFTPRPLAEMIGDVPLLTMRLLAPHLPAIERPPKAA